jgi:4-amino-4-deoxy-L-arabinose transferase-like glycosyltransferase
MTAAVRRLRPGWLAVGLITIYVLGVLPSLGQTLLESHAFRQTQTAYTAVLYAERGIDLLRPPLPILGPPGALPQEFPLFQAVGAIFISLGLSPDPAMRLTGLASFIATAALLFVLASRLMGSLGALVALAAFLFNAHAWLYGRTSLIEYLATAGGVGLLLFTLGWVDSSRPIHWTLALFAGMLAVLVKITTGVFYLVPLFFLRGRSGRWGFQHASIWLLAFAVLAVGYAWSWHAESVRSETPASTFLALENQYGWFLGTVGQRLDIGEWRVPLVAMLMLTGSGLMVWAPVAVQRARRLPHAPFAMAILALAVAVPLLLFNLYAVHDYYYIAIAPLVALGIGLGAERLWTVRSRVWARRAMVGLAGAWIATVIGLTGTWSLIYRTPVEQDETMTIAGYVRQHSEPDDWVVLRGLGWNPTFLYYARRQGIAVPDHSGLQDTSEIDFETIVDDPVFGPEITCDPTPRCRAEVD